VLTNFGPIHEEFREELKAFLGVQHLNLVSNATIGLIIALRSLRLTGEVITTPFSFPATAHAIRWAGLEPVFVDVDPDTGNIDPARVEEAITPRTSAVLGVHVYGNPCDVTALQEIGHRRGLKIIYDAAHAFGVTVNKKSILSYGDISVLSFHATKSFNTFEGGAVVSSCEQTERDVYLLSNFGIENETLVPEVGINGKMTEIQAALGLVQLNNFPRVRALRASLVEEYETRLSAVSGITPFANRHPDTSPCTYFPVLIGEKYPRGRDAIFWELRKKGFGARRYFYPLLSDLPPYADSSGGSVSSVKAFKIARNLSETVLCLPLYADLRKAHVRAITGILKNYSQ